MSSFSERMEHRNSTHTLSSRGNSEIGSRFRMESGFYITSFAATIFIIAIVTIGVLFLTLVTSLTFLLQSCQNSNVEFLELQETSDQYDYCTIFNLHAELNGLDVDEFPSICKEHAIQQIKEGQYLRDLNWTIWVVASHFSNIQPQADGLDVVLIDIDDVLTSPSLYRASPLQYRFDLHQESNQFEHDKLQAGLHILKLYSKLQASGWSLIFITRKSDSLRNETIENLLSSGYSNWSSLIMRSDDELLMESWEYFSRRRAGLQNLGFHITSVISSHMDALTGPCLGRQVFKLPSPPNYNLKHRAKIL